MSVAVLGYGFFKREKGCDGCRHLISQFSCDAFSNGMPGDILWGKHAHTEPYPGIIDCSMMALEIQAGIA